MQKMRILLTADPEMPIPPETYGGVERVVDNVLNGVVAEGHDVTLCAHADSKVPCKLIPWSGLHSLKRSDTLKNMVTFSKVALGSKFDVIHSFGRSVYMTAVLPFSVPKIKSYGRDPTMKNIKNTVSLSRKGSMVFTGCSDYITRQLQAEGEAYTIYNSVPIERYTPTYSVEPDAPLIYLGRIQDVKGTHIAVEVAQKCNRRLLIAGNIWPGCEEYFQRTVQAHLNDRIQYVGVVNDVQKNELLGKSAALLMPIQWNEPFGIVMAEAMACGTPVMAFPYGSVPEVVQDGVNGFICKDAADMAQKVADLHKIDRRVVRRIVEEKFSNGAIVKDYLKLYKTLVERRLNG